MVDYEDDLYNQAVKFRLNFCWQKTEWVEMAGEAD